MIFHTGPRRMFPLVREAIAAILPPERLRYIGFSHFEADECGSLNEFLADRARRRCRSAARSRPWCRSTTSPTGRRSRWGMANGWNSARHALRWFDTPHLPHAWECGFMIDDTTHTLLCGDLFTQPGEGKEALVETDILGPSEGFRGRDGLLRPRPEYRRAMLERLANETPTTLACMHGSAWQGDGAALLRALAESVELEHSTAA